MKDEVWFIYMVILKYKAKDLRSCFALDSKHLYGFYLTIKDFKMVDKCKYFGLKYLK